MPEPCLPSLPAEDCPCLILSLEMEPLGLAWGLGIQLLTGAWVTPSDRVGKFLSKATHSPKLWTQNTVSHGGCGRATAGCLLPWRTVGVVRQGRGQVRRKGEWRHAWPLPLTKMGTWEIFLGAPSWPAQGLAGCRDCRDRVGVPQSEVPGTPECLLRGADRLFLSRLHCRHGSSRACQASTLPSTKICLGKRRAQGGGAGRQNRWKRQ